MAFVRGNKRCYRFVNIKKEDMREKLRVELDDSTKDCDETAGLEKL